MTNHTNRTHLVTGATGTVGRQVVAELLRLGRPVRALTRDPARAALPDGVEVVRGDLTDPDTLRAALDGVIGLHLITFGDAYFTPLETGPRIVELAREAGVRRITVLNGGGPTPLEDAVRAGGIEWTVLMPVEFMGNALEWADGIRAADEVREPFTGRLSAMVHEGDIGAVAAVALTEDGHAGQEYVITGPEVLTVRDKAQAIAAARGREIRLVELSEAEAVERWRAEGRPQDVIDFLLEVYGDTPEVGRTVLGTVEKVTGRPARTFAQWARANAAAFRA
ncbi:NAD-dependent epimerase/dehydratase family protein [Streptomyces sp. WAC05374]|uniref:NmrA family NAD(P)-binding protein n=1 Tax=Streptomyces sp. WAC05374 TaxID=2487420 RepID=UPI000F88910E|nr:NmrA family NAD(P)-binding protein [Streptomyces sp. WAC05374]RST13111.1 NAD-dependent epimerase/dehydratase family protein [Streptomyces sp. WAC05374]TDF44790.1 NAD-dependent epimerase/dehydratase family protein [Streptomyces sp. WAC05374]TDF56030.1 NAD-dependent epimerase/dehydratase family protein [Streptomyces sp. WAC05374]TDF59797.1 NAD-dependent epimerase/dehydratase family protein [Streptomyces sp. WAC05374]